MRVAKDRYSIFILEGSILVLLGFIIWLYSQSVVSGLDQLVNVSATQGEITKYSSSLQWWRLQQDSLLNPLAVMLLAAGLVLVGNAIFWLVRRRHTN